MKEPVCTALLFADRIIVENNGKKGIIGTFSRIFAPSRTTSLVAVIRASTQTWPSNASSEQKLEGSIVKSSKTCELNFFLHG
jgi:hypothetical protein